MRYDDDPNKTKVWISAEESEEETERYPRISIVCGDLSNAKFGIDTAYDAQINRNKRLTIDQGYAIFTCTATSQVVARNMADHIRHTLGRASDDFGKRGITGLGSLATARPQGVEQGPLAAGLYTSTVNVSFYQIRRDSEYHFEADVWNRVIVNIDDKIIAGSTVDPPVVTSAVFIGRRVVRVTFNSAIIPASTQDIKIKVGNETISTIFSRHITELNTVIGLTLRDLGPGEEARAVYLSGETVRAYDGDHKVLPFNVPVTYP